MVFWNITLIIRRYLVKQVVSTSVVVIGLLTLIMMGGRLIKYFGIAAQGRLDASILFSILAYRLPEFLTLILPLGFFYCPDVGVWSAVCRSRNGSAQWQWREP